MSVPLSPIHRIPDDTWCVAELTQAFEALLDEPNSHRRLAVEEQKLLIIQCIEQKLKKEIPLLPTQEIAQEITQKKPTNLYFKSLLRRLFYPFFLIFGFFENIATSYFFGSALFALIPGITNPMLIIAAISYTIVEATLFYIFDVALLKDALGIPYANINLSHLLDAYAQQLKITMAMNQQLSTIQMLAINNETYDSYMQFALLLNKDMRDKHEAIGSEQTSMFKKILKGIVLVLAALSSIAGSYFMATSFMAMLAAPLLATPVGGLLIASIMLTGLGFHYFMGAGSMSRLVNPDYDRYQELKKEWDLFHAEHQDDLTSTYAMKHRFEKKQTQDASTQTNPIDEALYQPGMRFFTPAHVGQNTPDDLLIACRLSI